MTMTATDPYADAYNAYWSAGWRGVLPLPYRAKKQPPDGYTGRSYREPSYADCAAWADGGPKNIALHLPRGVVGIDVDDYAGKGGGATLSGLVAECGPLPPTWLSSSRGDGISGIRLYRVPDDADLIGGLTGIEIIQYSHRYVVCWPSVHPEGMTYEWVNEDTGESGVPPVDALPPLPAKWLERLRRTTAAATKADIGDAGVAEFFAGLPVGDPCQHMMSAAGLAMRSKSRHEAYNDAVLGVLSAARGGCPGAAATLARLKASFVAEIADRADRAEAEREWLRNVLGAVALVVADKPEQGAGCPDDYLAGLILAETAQDSPAATERGDEAGQAQPPQGATTAPDEARKLAVARKAGELALMEDARALVASWRAGQAPPLGGHNLSAFLAQPDEPVAYRIDRLWPINGRVLLAAAAKAGKTTMVMNLLKALADGGTFLGCYDVAQVTDGTIVYLNLEVSENQMRRWMRRAGIVNADRIVVANLRGQISALTLGSETGRKRVTDWLRGLNAEVVVLDPLAPLLGSLGLEEKENSDIARFFAWWSEMLHDAGVREDFICHHAGWDGTRSRGASRLVDEPDAVWTINRDKATDEDGDDVYGIAEPRFFKAVGRDVEQAEQPLSFDGASGLLTLSEGSRSAMRRAAREYAAERRVLEGLREAGEDGMTRRDVENLGGNKGENYDAVERLLGAGKVVKKELNSRHHRYEIAPWIGVPSVPGDTPGTRGHVVSPTPIGGDTTCPTTDTPGICEDCGGDTGSAGFKICTGCERKRRQS